MDHRPSWRPPSNPPRSSPRGGVSEAFPGLEPVDVYDDEGTWLGTEERAAAHVDGAWHRCIHCLVVARRAGALSLTLQRRAWSISEYPGLIDVSVAGHLHAGEGPEHAAAREVQEEFGISVPDRALQPLGQYRLVVRSDGVFSRELTDVFVIHDDRPVDAFPVDHAEVHSLVAIDLADAIDLWLGLRDEAPVLETTDAGPVSRLVVLAAFVNDVPDYWRWLAGSLQERFGPSRLSEVDAGP